MLELRDKMKPHVKVDIGDGKSTSGWYDPWCGCDSLAKYIYPNGIYMMLGSVTMPLLQT